MASEHEKMRDEVAKTIAKAAGDLRVLDWHYNTARSTLALIAERTKQATPEMIAAWRKRSCQPLEPELDWSAMHAASALWPSHGTDGKEEKAK